MNKCQNQRFETSIVRDLPVFRNVEVSLFYEQNAKINAVQTSIVRDLVCFSKC